ncbi:MAG: competence/damage-inducible protein A [Firmicutes bacterium]|nr:competence/damage-inducible protein A [Bacillota bacterium]
MLNAEIISVGTELLLGQIVDTNAVYIARALPGLGISVYRKTVVGDNPGRLAAVVREALGRADILVVTGGLGPTEDDVTREVVADVLGVPLVESSEVLADITRVFMLRGLPMVDSNHRQAMVPRTGTVIRNQVGTAPGLIFEPGDKRVICLPGVPREMRWMMENHVIPYLREYCAVQTGGLEVIRSRVIKTAGIGESRLESLILDLAHGRDNPTVATYAGEGECQVRVTARAASARLADDMVAATEAEIRSRLGRLVYGIDDQTLEGVVGQLLTASGLTLACAESCTGGLISHRLTNVPGSSRYFDRGIVTYSNESKVQELDVDPSTLAEDGAVSRKTATEMARGARRVSGADLGLAVTGIAGPGGGTEEKPVGLVYFALVHRSGVITARARFGGERETIKNRTAQFALDLLRWYLEEASSCPASARSLSS